MAEVVTVYKQAYEVWSRSNKQLAMHEMAKLSMKIANIYLYDPKL